MNLYTFIICALVLTVSDYKEVSARTTYDNPSYNNDRDENLSVLAAHQNKRVANEDVLREEEQAEEYERNVPMYEPQRYRKFEPDSSFSRQNRLEKNRDLAEFDDNKMNMQKRDYYDVAANAKDASIEVILDPRAKKAVAVVENSPSGQAMYDLSGWKNKDENAPYESDQYGPGAQQQVVNLVYPAERNDRKYAPNAFDSNSDYSDKSKGEFKDKLIENERTVEDTHKKKRNAEKETDKRSVQSKRKIDQTKSDISKQASNECPPHNTPSTMEIVANKNSNENKQQSKREAPQWSQDQLDALKNSLAHVREDSGEVLNLRNILSNMGLIDDAQIANKRETVKLDADSPAELRDDNKEKVNTDLKADTEDEDLNQDNIILKRNDREVNNEENKAPAEPVEKREAESENNSEEENAEAFETENEKKEVKRSNEENQAAIETAKEEVIAKADEPISRKKRQDAEKNQDEANKTKNPEKCNENPASDSEMNKSNIDNSKKYTKRDINSDTSKDLRKNRQNAESDEEYEKRMENQIQAKIDAIKDKVKREIYEAQLKRRSKRNLNAEASKSNIRKRRQSKEQNKEEASKAVKNSENSVNEEKSIASKAESQGKRRKRANTLPEKQMVYRAYQADQDKEAEEDAEFDDNSYDGRMYVEKRQAEEDSDYFDPVRKREVENYLRQYYPEPRARRSFDEGFGEDSSAFHGSRRALKNKGFTGGVNKEDYSKSNENNDSEYFGSLPQTYNGELTRYKRVKRDNPYK